MSKISKIQINGGATYDIQDTTYQFELDGNTLKIGVDGGAKTSVYTPSISSIAENVSGVVAIANGGTGANTASDARSNLGLGSAATYTVATSVGNNSYLPTGAAIQTYVSGQLTSVLKYKGTIGSSGATVTALPAVHKVGDVYVVAAAGTYAGKSVEIGDYIICRTAGTTANNSHWDVINGENQVDNKATSLAGAGSSATIATVDGTNITVTTPSTWTGLDKTGTVTSVNVGSTSYNPSNGVVSLPAYPTSLPASDVHSWAKASNKPSYNYSEISGTPTIPTKVSQLTNDSGFTSNTGTVTKVIAGTGLTGGSITTTGTISLATSGVTAGTYKRVTVDAYGRVTAGDNTDSDTTTTINGKTGAIAAADIATVLTNGGYKLTDTNTWRGITDNYRGTDSATSLSQKGGNALYNALVNGYATTAGTAEQVSVTLDGSNVKDVIYANIANNDFFRLRVGGTAANAGYAELATADDGNEPIYVRQYSGVFDTLLRTATLLDASGNTIFPGNVTSAKFVKSGGTSAQFLKADGSVDSNTYLTSHQDISGKADKASITAGTAGTSSATSGSSLSVPYVTVNTLGVVTGYGTHTHTITGFLTSHLDISGKQNTISDLSTIRSNATNGNTAYGWGNHANAGYLKGISSTVAITAATSSSCSITGSTNSGKQQTIIYTNSGSSDLTVTVPTTYKTPDGAAIELTCPGGGYCEVNYLNIGGTIYARGL